MHKPSHLVSGRNLSMLRDVKLLFLSQGLHPLHELLSGLMSSGEIMFAYYGGLKENGL